MTPVDALGVVGVLLILIAYAGATSGRLDARHAPALLLNLAGALLILVSLYVDFNLSAVLMEGAWALVAVVGLGRLAFQRLKR
ncbi:hypothetical protein [uncultured Brevundimonas sp.]|uniref:CBU_0592 family membrane protein n=1 Tax=uncultured Brevundimonas sp. TaxID=213418 RepID=UPI0030EE6B3F